MAKKNKQAWELNIGVKFGTASAAAKTASVGVKIDASRLPLDRADELFCGRRLTGTLIVGHTEDDPTQKDLIEDATHKVSGTFDVNSFTKKAAGYSITLSFGKLEVDPEEFWALSGESGRLIITSSENIPEPEKKPNGPAAQQKFDADEADDDEDFADDELESANA